jgi:hypothetical protein
MKILNSITWKLNWIELNSNSIEEKWDANWWKSYCEFDCGYGVGKNKIKTQIQEDIIPCLFIWKWAK